MSDGIFLSYAIRDVHVCIMYVYICTYLLPHNRSYAIKKLIKVHHFQEVIFHEPCEDRLQ